MNQSLPFLIGIIVGCTAPLAAYTKIRYVQLPGMAREQVNMRIQAPFDLMGADYALTDATGAISWYVHLSKSDRRKIGQVLRWEMRTHQYDATEIISDALIRRYAAASRSNMQVVGLVLQDFKMRDAQATLGSVLKTLGIK